MLRLLLNSMYYFLVFRFVDWYLSNSETNRTGPYTASINVAGFASATKLTGNRTLLSKWLTSTDKQFYASNPSLGRKAVYKIERQRLLWNNPWATLEYVFCFIRECGKRWIVSYHRIYCAPGLSFPQFFEPNTSYVQVASIQSHPFSRGSIHLNSSDPLVPPLIDLNAWAFNIGMHYVSPQPNLCWRIPLLCVDMADKEIAIQGAKYVRRVAHTAPFAKLIQSYVYPQMNVTTDEDWSDFIASTISNPYHPTGMHTVLSVL